MAAKKLGLLALAGAFVLKFAKIIIFAVVGFGAAVMNFFRRKPRNDNAGGPA
ncbi:putative transmembrane protein [Bradyrhizobium oligotrophicum S58]|uniref:Putative transmembrane protein n=1 Tax=Bradyrhizobium oligotrophicum S58 TaxID=1245469 RepID=M4Z8B8_9BRAD|nr:putative transmembrane protein [Bradyrhizobium oligotrophicum S58]